ncbi:hypothetical protein PAPYR_7234 [Paratrimastix pyriformis]|uniref:Ubiquitin-like domain-containing protein n=1 Tax=Paratrimastix pyriformis TaxID=342808 RepID=A0ABQ8UDH6_9EUKA|nr:hypothetical protein PAPYR_7234 [Paratrimastix pyriformis]
MTSKIMFWYDDHAPPGHIGRHELIDILPTETVLNAKEKLLSKVRLRAPAVRNISVFLHGQELADNVTFGTLNLNAESKFVLVVRIWVTFEMDERRHVELPLLYDDTVSSVKARIAKAFGHCTADDLDIIVRDRPADDSHEVSMLCIDNCAALPVVLKVAPAPSPDLAREVLARKTSDALPAIPIETVRKVIGTLRLLGELPARYL